MNISLLRINIDSEKELLLRCVNSLKNLPKGGLSCYTKNNRTYYKRNGGSRQEHIGNADAILVKKLKKRHLLETMIPILKNNICLMEQLSSGYQDYNPLELQKQFRKPYQDLPFDLLNELGYIFNPSDNIYKEAGKLYKTISGLMVRSRIEALIADIYTQKNITFEYEAELYFSDGSMIHPDFKVYCSSCDKVKYHEHIGLLHEPNYLKNYLWKLEHYISHGLYPFYDVLFTYEKPDQGIDMNEIGHLIDLYMR